MKQISKDSIALLFLLAAGIAPPLCWYAVAGQGVVVAGGPLPFRPSPIYEQAAIVISFFGIKTIYTIAAAAIIWILRRAKAADLVALRWAMLAFFIGEAFCFINVMAFHDQSVLMEHLHSVGMVASLAFGAYAVLEGADARVIHCAGDGRCALATMCHGCAKHSDSSCGLLRLFRWTLPIIAIMALLPLFAPLRGSGYETRVFGALHTYRHNPLHQLYELRYLPLAGLVLTMASFIAMLGVNQPHSSRLKNAKVLLAAALGAISFSFFRLILVAAFESNQVWFGVWEELLELLTIAAAGCVLFVFRGRLLAVENA